MFRATILVGLVAGLCAASQGSEPEAVNGSHQVQTWGIIRAFDASIGQVRLETNRRELIVEITATTRIRLASGEGQTDDLRVGQTVSCAGHWLAGKLQCRELLIMPRN